MNASPQAHPDLVAPRRPVRLWKAVLLGSTILVTAALGVSAVVSLGDPAIHGYVAQFGSCPDSGRGFAGERVYVRTDRGSVVVILGEAQEVGTGGFMGPALPSCHYPFELADELGGERYEFKFRDHVETYQLSYLKGEPGGRPAIIDVGLDI